MWSYDWFVSPSPFHSIQPWKSSEVYKIRTTNMNFFVRIKSSVCWQEYVTAARAPAAAAAFSSLQQHQYSHSVWDEPLQKFSLGSLGGIWINVMDYLSQTIWVYVELRFFKRLSTEYINGTWRTIRIPGSRISYKNILRKVPVPLYGILFYLSFLLSPSENNID